MKTGISKRSVFLPSAKIKGIEAIYKSKMPVVKRMKPKATKRKARFRTMIGKFEDDPCVLA